MVMIYSLFGLVVENVSSAPFHASVRFCELICLCHPDVILYCVKLIYN